MQRGIIQHLTKESVTWDNTFLKVIAASTILTMAGLCGVGHGLKEGVRKTSKRRRDDIEITDELKDDSLLAEALPDLTEYERDWISPNQRRQIVRQFQKTNRKVMCLP